jgi:hypothetical protein
VLRWRWIVGSTVDIVLIGVVVAVASVSHLVIGKRFEIEIEIKDSNYMHQGIMMIEILFR